MSEYLSLTEVSSIRERVLRNEPVTDDELRQVINAARAGRMSAAVSSTKQTKEAKALAKQKVLPSLDELFK